MYVGSYARCFDAKSVNAASAISRLLLASCFLSMTGLSVQAGAADDDNPSERLHSETARLASFSAKKSRDEVSGLVEELSSPVYAKREHASTRLIEIGQIAFPKLRDAYHSCDDLEHRLRIERVVFDAYMESNVWKRNGFLGCQRLNVPLTHADDRRIPTNALAIKVVGIIPRTEAERAGLQRSDLILELNGRALSGPANCDAVRRFGELIRNTSPGKVVRLTVLRGPRTLYTDVTIERRPKRFYGGASVASTMLRNAQRQFDLWWTGSFRNPPMPRGVH